MLCGECEPERWQSQSAFIIAALMADVWVKPEAGRPEAASPYRRRGDLPMTLDVLDDAQAGLSGHLIMLRDSGLRCRGGVTSAQRFFS